MKQLIVCSLIISLIGCSSGKQLKTDGIYVFDTTTVLYEMGSDVPIGKDVSIFLRFYSNKECSILTYAWDDRSHFNADSIGSWFNRDYKKEHESKFAKYEWKDDTLSFIDPMDGYSPTLFRGVVYEDSIVLRVEKMLEGHELGSVLKPYQTFKYYPFSK